VRVSLVTKKKAPVQGERVRVCGLVYYVADADDPDDLGDGRLVGEYDIQPADAGKGSAIHDAQLVRREADR
jgi:hypothetical protein